MINDNPVHPVHPVNILFRISVVHSIRMCRTAAGWRASRTASRPRNRPRSQARSWSSDITSQHPGRPSGERPEYPLITGTLACSPAHIATNCVSISGCGPYVGGTMYQKLGLVKPWTNTKDLGRFEETKQDQDKMMFKVPGLRNVEKTGPYYHDGSVETLEEAVKTMASFQLGKDLKDDEVKSIVAWLKTLTGELPMAYIAMPTLPPVSPKTAKPNPN